MAGKLYAFRHHNRDLCLRPELTASVVRAYVAYLQNASLPLRLAYNGPVFRYETPGRGRYRQFTEVGLELIGAGTPAADAEVIHIAAAGLERLGLRDYEIVIGHIGIAQTYLAGLALDGRVRDWLTWSMEDLRRHDEEQVHHALSAVLPAANGAPPALDEALAAIAPAADWAALPPGEAERVVLRVLDSAGFDLSGSRRAPEEIARRLVGKLSRRRGTTLRAGATCAGSPRAAPRPRCWPTCGRCWPRRVSQTPPSVRSRRCWPISARMGCRPSGSPSMPDWGAACTSIPASSSRSTLAPMAPAATNSPVVGATTTWPASSGPRRTPACGFAYGLERVVEALQARGLTPAPAPNGPEVLVCAVSPAESAYAIRIAQALRAEGRRVELDVRGRGVRANLETANRRAIPYVAIVGEAEQRASAYTWRDMAQRSSEFRVLSSE
jgi:histidyl-tRNA synthetase